MATTATNVTATAYVEVVDDTVTDAIIQNRSSHPMRLSFAADLSVPSANTNDYHIIPAGESFEIVAGSPAGSAHVRCDTEERAGDVVVSTNVV